MNDAITCTRCGDEDGPFAEEHDGYVCEGCLHGGPR